MRISSNDPLELLRLGVTLSGGEEEVSDTSESEAATPAASETTTPEPTTPEPVAATPPPAPAPQEQWNDIRDYAKANGLNIDHIQDSEAAARYLIDMARNNSAYAQYGQQLAPYYQDIQRYLAQRQQPAPQQQQAPQPRSYFGLPEYNPEWLDFLERDAAGNIVPKVGAPPDIVGKVVQYQKALQNFQTNFWKEPEKYLQPMIQDAVAPLVQRTIQQNLAGYQDQVFATNFVSQNSNWLHYRDTQGQVIRDPITGGYSLTPEGQLFVQHLKRAETMGISNLQSQQQYAMDQMRLAYFAQQQNQQQAVQGAAQQNQQFLQTHNRRTPNHAGSLNAGPDVSQNANLSLYDRLKRDLPLNGITDAALVADLR